MDYIYPIGLYIAIIVLAAMYVLHIKEQRKRFKK
jgi:hypothetical protein